MTSSPLTRGMKMSTMSRSTCSSHRICMPSREVVATEALHFRLLQQLCEDLSKDFLVIEDEKVVHFCPPLFIIDQRNHKSLTRTIAECVSLSTGAKATSSTREKGVATLTIWSIT